MRGIITNEHNPLTEAARNLRQRQTEAERILWFKLRDRQLDGVKFRKQVLVGRYIVDFISFSEKLVIEIDGSPHTDEEVKKSGRQRTLWLESEGFTVLRFWNGEILRDLDSVAGKIKAAVKH